MRFCTGRSVRSHTDAKPGSTKLAACAAGAGANVDAIGAMTDRARAKVAVFLAVFVVNIFFSVIPLLFSLFCAFYYIVSTTNPMLQVHSRTVWAFCNRDKEVLSFRAGPSSRTTAVGPLCALGSSRRGVEPCAPTLNRRFEC